MRRLLVSCAFVATLSCVQAEDQEGRLMERLLRPDMRLQNAAQNKKLNAMNRASVDKRATTGTFYVWKQSTCGHERFQASTRDVSAWQQNARSFYDADKRAGVSSRQQIPDLKRTYSTSTARNLRRAQEADTTVEAPVFAGSRPFLGEGKSQKLFNRRNPPLTVEQVRELLNKNK